MLCMEEESVDHLFIHCAMAREVWVFFLSHLKSPWIFLNAFNELISGWCFSSLEGFLLSIWRAFPGVICWGLWKKRNSRIFEDKFRSLNELVLFIYNMLFDWVVE